jgi:hypothetical protein
LTLVNHEIILDVYEPTNLSNLVNLAQPNKGTSYANWLLDSGASRHVTGTSSECSSYNSFPLTRNKTIQTADETAHPIKCVGTVQCTPLITLPSVSYVPLFPINVLSIVLWWIVWIVVLLLIEKAA